MSLFVQFIDDYGRRCDHAATSGLLLEVPQTQFIARVRGHSSRHRDGYASSVYGGDEVFFSRFFRIFRAPPGRPGVERQFSEPLTMKSSSSSRAPAQ